MTKFFLPHVNGGWNGSVAFISQKLSILKNPGISILTFPSFLRNYDNFYNRILSSSIKIVPFQYNQHTILLSTIGNIIRQLFVISYEALA